MKALKYYLLSTLVLTLFLCTPKHSNAQQKDDCKEVTIWASMHCQSCQKKIEREIAFEKGVKSVTVDLKEKKVTIKYKTDKNTDEKLADAIKKLGYDVKILSKEEKKKDSK
jgi:periplasmic mercuric ion binding protein